MRNEPPASEEAPALTGRLEWGGALLPVTLRCASGISLHASFDAGHAPPAHAVFTRLLVDLPQAEVALTRCRLVNPSTEGGRLVFLDDLYDCRSLVWEGKVVNLRGFFEKLPLVLAQKDQVRPGFREYTTDVLFELSSYKKFFNEQDRILSQEPRPVVEAAEEALLAKEGRDFLAYFDGKLRELEEQVEGYGKEEHERHGFFLRRLAWDFIADSEFLRRTNLKPRGYAGDAEMMVMVYENRFVGRSLFKKLLRKHPLETVAAQAVRHRRRLVAQHLEEVMGGHRGSGPVRAMSVAAGPAWELEDLFQRALPPVSLQCVLLDQDPYALSLARHTVERIQAPSEHPLSVLYVNESVRTMLSSADLKERLGRFHCIYSMGLFDYLTPPVARAVLRKLFELLLPGGRLLVGNFHWGNPTRVYMAYWMDWVLYHRSEGELLELGAELGESSSSISFDPTGCQMFLRVEKLR